MEAKHTPGPWRYNEERCCIESVNDWACAPDPDLKSVVDLTGAMGGDDVEADAHLIAAAPEMYDALERLTRIVEVELGATRPEVIEQARAAIAKAEGK